jgi:hypothetical protein
LLQRCLQCTAGSCYRAIKQFSDLPLLFITLSVLATTTGGLVFILLLAELPRIVAAMLVFIMLILTGIASATREYYTNDAIS